jgi:hypothetical protein
MRENQVGVRPDVAVWLQTQQDGTAIVIDGIEIRSYSQNLEYPLFIVAGGCSSCCSCCSCCSTCG